MIPVFEPLIEQDDIDAVTQAVTAGEISGTFGKSIPAFEEEFAAYCGCKHAVSVSSGTAALHLAMAAMGIESGDEVLMSASTNIATALGVAHHNATPISVDCEADTWNMDTSLLRSLITPKTKAIIPVHLYGHPVDMDPIMELADEFNLTVVEDAAEAHGATCHGRMVGSLGHMACFSFYANKIMTTGEGGMVTTDDDALADKLRLLRNLAFEQPRFLHRFLGYNFRMTGIQAALGRSQLRKIDTFIEGKRRLAATYNQLFSDIPGVTVPVEKPWAKNVYWMYGIVIEPEFGMDRETLMHRLSEAKIGSRTFFAPMNIQPALKECPGYRAQDCPVAERLWERGLYIPSSVNITPQEQEAVASVIRQAARG